MSKLLPAAIAIVLGVGCGYPEFAFVSPSFTEDATVEEDTSSAPDARTDTLSDGAHDAPIDTTLDASIDTNSDAARDTIGDAVVDTFTGSDTGVARNETVVASSPYP